MTKTALDVCTYALRRIGVTPVGEEPAGEDMTLAQAALEAFLSEIKDTHGATFTWTSSAVPDASYVPLARVVACDIAPSYPRPMPEPRGRAVLAFRAGIFPNNIDDRRDTNDDGTISTAEANAGLEAQYY